MPQKPVTEQQILDAMDVYSEGWVEQLARRAKNQGLALSDATLLELGDFLCKPELMDELVRIRVEKKGGYTLQELMPPFPQRSICRIMTPVAGAQLFASTGARLNSDMAYNVWEYCLGESDDETSDDRAIEIILGMSRMPYAECVNMLNDYGYGGDANALLARLYPNRASAGARVAKASAPAQAVASKPKGRGGLYALLIVLGIGAFVVLALTVGVLAIGVVFAVVLLVVVLGLSSAGGDKPDKFPDVRSDFNRRTWADDHNWDADGDNDHNWDADGN